MIRIFLTCAALAAATLTAQTAAAQSCPEIKFARGSFAGEVAGRVTENQPLCFSFGSGAGQTARIQVFGSNNVCFGVAGIIDCQTDFTFTTRRQQYFINVLQLFAGPGSETFTLRLTIR